MRLNPCLMRREPSGEKGRKERERFWQNFVGHFRLTRRGKMQAERWPHFLFKKIYFFNPYVPLHRYITPFFAFLLYLFFFLQESEFQMHYLPSPPSPHPPQTHFHYSSSSFHPPPSLSGCNDAKVKRKNTGVVYYHCIVVQCYHHSIKMSSHSQRIAELF